MRVPISPNSNHFFLFHLFDAFIEDNIHDRFAYCKLIHDYNRHLFTVCTKKECGAKVKTSFATDSPINDDQKSVFSEI